MANSNPKNTLDNVILHHSGATSPRSGRVRATRADEKDGDGVSEEAAGFHHQENDDIMLGAATGNYYDNNGCDVGDDDGKSNV